ncbi:hypothetical protein LH19_14615 [Sphingopyxis macrogoltabida]|nr:hypothetical protein LH19_14615 [Sphingopyxis macrogoltabida]
MKDHTPWLALWPLATLMVAAQDKSSADADAVIMASAIVAGCIILAVWGLCSLIKGAFND